MNNKIKLTNGEFLFKDFGKYGSRLHLIHPSEELLWEVDTPENYNLPTTTLYSLKGEYYESKKGTKCFHIKADGPHVLLRDPWGGAYNHYRGGSLPEDNLYFYRASSNKGGCGCDYAVVPVGWQKELSIEDI